MSKYNHSKKVRRARRWYVNVGDGAKLSKDNLNPNDKPKYDEARDKEVR